MKSYIFPVTLAVAGAALMITYKSDQEKKIELPPMPKLSVVGGKDTRLVSIQKSEEVARIAPSSLTPAQFRKGAINPRRNSNFDKPYEFFHDRLLMLNQCLETGNCPFPNRDPKDYEIAVHAEAKTTLEALTTWQKRHHLRDARVTALMVNFLAFENAAVKQEALKILATQATHDGVLEPLLEYVIEYPQPDAIADGMNELQRYRSSDQRRKIDETLEQVLRNGAVNAATEIAKNVGPLIDSKNRARYVKIRDELARSPLSEEIYFALSESLGN